jgi:hypothetical protein
MFSFFTTDSDPLSIYSVRLVCFFLSFSISAILVSDGFIFELVF